MPTPPFTIREAASGDLPRVREILALAELPLEGVEAVDVLLVATRDGITEGCAALEVRGSDALLRSVAVSQAFRGAALGTALVQAALERARAAGVHRVHLLTTTARSFFEGLGFEVRPRETAPPAIADTAEFRVLCPGSAVLMERRLPVGGESRGGSRG